MPKVIHSHLPDNLDEFLAQQESRYSDIKSGTEKKIIWHDEIHKTKTEYAIVYLHGFSASRQEIYPASELVAAKLQSNLFLTRLTGHGRAPEAMLELSVDGLINDALEALEIGKKLGGKVIVIGNSTGATLATYLASEFPESIHALVLLSPNYGLKRKSSELLLLPFPHLTVSILQGPHYEFDPENSLQEKYWTCQYPSKALIPMMRLLKLVRNLALEKIKLPIMVLYCPQDQVINVNVMRKIIKRFKSSLIVVESITPQGSKKHVLAGDVLSPGTTQLVVEKILTFIDKARGANQ